MNKAIVPTKMHQCIIAVALPDTQEKNAHVKYIRCDSDSYPFAAGKALLMRVFSTKTAIKMIEKGNMEKFDVYVGDLCSEYTSARDLIDAIPPESNIEFFYLWAEHKWWIAPINTKQNYTINLTQYCKLIDRHFTEFTAKLVVKNYKYGIERTKNVIKEMEKENKKDPKKTPMSYIESVRLFEWDLICGCHNFQKEVGLPTIKMEKEQPKTPNLDEQVKKHNEGKP